MSADNIDKPDSTTNTEEHPESKADVTVHKGSGKHGHIQKTLDIDGHRPIDPSSFEVESTVNIDGERPIAKSDIVVQEIYEIDRERPIADNHLPDDTKEHPESKADVTVHKGSGEHGHIQKTLDIDGHRPIDPSSFEVESTVNIDGERPIAKSDIGVQEIYEIDGERPIADNHLPYNETLNIDGQRPIDPSELKVSRSVNIDGWRPVSSANNTKNIDKITTDYLD
ncbi:MAG: hypothetical protein PUP93_19410 [Rhizonema sp. NSF051]|nr:hypothetical protein [Rhizonema sp. NSF051]